MITQASPVNVQAIVQNLGRVGRGRMWVAVTSQERLNEVVSGLDDNRIEVESPGRLPAHITEANILDERFSRNGVIAGCFLVFIPALGEFVIPSLLGGPGTQMIGRILWDEFFSKTNWPRAAALAITMLVIIVIPIMLMQRAQNAVVEGRTR